MSINTTCPSCGQTNIFIFYKLKQVPVHSVLLLPSRQEALNYPKGDIALAFCADCGFIFNALFDPNKHEYSARYEETQGFSSTFNIFSKNLAQRLIDRYDLHGKNIIEIGCGKGEFLTLLCDLGQNRGVGFDPAYIDERNQNPAKDRISFIKDFYSEKYAHYQGDFVCCKMTLEHIQNTADFVGMVRRSIGDQPDTIVFFQIPDVVRILRDVAFWDIYYEHCSYFSKGSLARLFRRCGFNVLDLSREYDDQYLMIDAKPGKNGAVQTPLPEEDDLEALKQDVAYFVENYPKMLDEWRYKLKKIKDDGRKAVIWGAGSKGVAFLITLNVQNEIEYAVDINPYKHGYYMAGTGQEIVAPEFLQSYKPDIVIVMNPIYCDEISRDLERMGITAELMPV